MAEASACDKGVQFIQYPEQPASRQDFGNCARRAASAVRFDRPAGGGWLPAKGIH